jgi:hypothetical protein
VAPSRVELSVDASDPDGNPLRYAWRVTEGSVTDVDAPSAIWTLPPGPGLHFAYVLVSNGKGGYTERRLAVSTDDIGIPAAAPPPVDFQAPPAGPPAGTYYQSVIRGSGYYGPDDDGIYIPDARAYLADTGTGSTTPIATTDLRGSFTIPHVEPGTYDLYCALDAVSPFEVCQGGITIPVEAVSDPYQGPQNGRGDVTGRLVLADGNPCGTVNEFFGTSSSARGRVLDSVGRVVAGPYRLNEFGHFGFDAVPGAVSLRFECEGTTPVTIPMPAGVAPRVVLADGSAPIVSGMSARLDGEDVGRFLPPPTGLPSDHVAGADFFLTFKGIDSRLGACRYYQAIGAVKACDGGGNLVDPITFDDWKRTVGLEPYALEGKRDIVATYVNEVDLNLTRNHHSISYGPDRTAAYVCNHLGPMDETQAAADAAIDDAVRGRNLIACVAMDFGVTAGVNGDQPFTRFLIFGPSGQLLPSVNLDGRGEKFAPGSCVACHGGDRKAGRFPEDGTGAADIGAHFLPYDVGNFRFSSRPGLTGADQEAAIYQLNQNVLRTGPNPATTALIQGWYASGGPPLDTSYIPPSWRGQSATSLAFYSQVYARSCRTCHVAQSAALNFDDFANIDGSAPPVFESGRLRTELTVCTGGSASFLRDFSMPNSLHTFDRFWRSAGTAVDQPAIVAAFTGQSCALRTSPDP